MTVSNRKNFCGGNYDDWLEVMLTDKCNGGCNWCIEKDGYRPTKNVCVEKLAEMVIFSQKQNVILLGGEPTLYPELERLVRLILYHSSSTVNIYITTNGSLLSPELISKLHGIKGVNISIHHYDLWKNKEITGLLLDQERIESSIIECRKHNVIVRFNCNVIRGYIDNEDEINQYIAWAKITGADKIRFAELKGDEYGFVNLYEIYHDRYGVNNDPFISGCNNDTMIAGIPVNFRQMCGLQTKNRPKPVNPKCVSPKEVLYYDGIIYNGWQTVGKTLKPHIKARPESSCCY